MNNAQDNHNLSTQARCQLYHSFSQALSHPVPVTAAAIADGSLREQLIDIASHLPYEFAFSPNADTTETLDSNEVRYRYTSCFEVGNAPVSIRESHHSSQPEKEIFEELFRFYKHFGLDFSDGALREYPDMLPVELEFLHYLCFLEAASAEPLPLQRAQLDFLQRHPARWLTPLCLQLGSSSATVPYLEITTMLQCFVDADITFLQKIQDSQP